MNDLIVSYIRTGVPILVGAALSYLVTLGIEVDQGSQNALVIALTGVLQAAYYAVARAVERRWPKVGVLLGKKAEPVYDGHVGEHGA